MSKYVRNLRAGRMGLKRISLSLAAKGTPGDARPFRNAAQAKHPEVLAAVKQGWIEVLTQAEYMAHIGKGPTVAKPVVAPVVPPLQVVEPEPEPEPAQELDAPTLVEFKALTAKDMASVIDDVGLADDVDQRSKRKMVTAYKTWLEAQS